MIFFFLQGKINTWVSFSVTIGVKDSWWKGSSKLFLCRNSFSRTILSTEMEYPFSSIHSVLHPSPPAQMMSVPSHPALFSSFCLIRAVSRRSSLRIWRVYILMRSGTVVSPEELDWQPYLLIGTERNIAANLLCPAPSSISLFPSPYPLFLCPWFPVFTSCTEEQSGFCWQRCYRACHGGKVGRVWWDVGVHCCCVWVGANVNSVILCFQTTREGSKPFLIPNLFLKPFPKSFLL